MSRPVLALAALLTSAASLDAAETASARRSNVLFIAVDDMNCDLGCYGHDLVKSPNIDRLAARGVRFGEAYCQYLLCSPSRSSLMTGRRPDSVRIYDLKTHFRETTPDIVTLPQLFRKNGYFVGRVGKIYHYGNPGDIGTPGLDDPAAWQVAINPAGRDKAQEPLVTNFTPKRGLGSSLSFLAADGADEEQTDGPVAAAAVSLLEQHRNGPFFIAAGFYTARTASYVAPKRYFDLYPLDKVSVPSVSRADVADVPAAALQSTRPWPWLDVGREEARRSRRAYYATTSFVDAQVGRLLDAVDRLGLSDNTIFVFWSDHGYFLGEKGLWKKQSLFERAARVPLVFAGPGIKEGGVSPRPVELVDLYPALADLCELTPPPGLDGVSMKPLLENPQAARDHPAYTQVHRGKLRGYSVRTGRWRYTEWGEDGAAGVEFYDHEADPEENKNLGKDPGHAEIVAELKPILHRVSQAAAAEGGAAAK
jgi:uncharacterized sulfatase